MWLFNGARNCREGCSLRGGTCVGPGLGCPCEHRRSSRPPRSFLPSGMSCAPATRRILGQVAVALVELAADQEFFAPLIAQMPAASPTCAGWSSPSAVRAWCWSTGRRGDDMLLFEREEYDPEQGTWQRLAPGDPGRSNR